MASDAVGLDNDEECSKIGKKDIVNLKRMLVQAKSDIELPKKRATIITPELFELAKKQRII